MYPGLWPLLALLHLSTTNILACHWKQDIRNRPRSFFRPNPLFSVPHGNTPLTLQFTFDPCQSLEGTHLQVVAHLSAVCATASKHSSARISNTFICRYDGISLHPNLTQLSNHQPPPWLVLYRADTATALRQLEHVDHHSIITRWWCFPDEHNFRLVQAPCRMSRPFRFLSSTWLTVSAVAKTAAVRMTAGRSATAILFLYYISSNYNCNERPVLPSSPHQAILDSPINIHTVITRDLVYVRICHLN